MNNFDFNLLIVLHALLENDSVNLAAKKLNVTPPAISKSLSKIRILFNDQILVRSGIKLLPTPKAIALKKDIQEIILRIESILNTHIQFEPKNTITSFTIASNSTIIFSINALLFKEIQHNAPNIFINLIHESNYNNNLLRINNIDLYIGEMRDLNPEITTQTIYSAKYYCICRHDHPILFETKNINDLLKYQFLQTQEEYPTNTNDINKHFWSARHLIGITPGYITTLNAIVHSDILAIVPDFTIATIQKLNIPITFFNTDFDLGTRDIIQAWHSKYNHSPSHQWLRNLTKKTFINSTKTMNTT